MAVDQGRRIGPILKLPDHIIPNYSLSDNVLRRKTSYVINYADRAIEVGVELAVGKLNNVPFNQPPTDVPNPAPIPRGEVRIGAGISTWIAGKIEFKFG